ncbi:unnamed protein product [Miscanthus lutarioriparius]|uniref:F-box domain-containing protein n=1 Tax=Miscanthus lutarioriparius TaxID=422564 RepID=A0A811MAL5_9POAL|nr:unnamed protein product [Miscanthus lutarioriparius]
MQSKHRIFAEDLLLAAEGEDHFDRVPDSLVLLIFNKLADARSLGRCSAVSRRFNALVPLVDDACLRIDRVIPADGGDALGGPRPRAVLSHLLKVMLQAVLKPFAHCDAKSAAAARTSTVRRGSTTTTTRRRRCSRTSAASATSAWSSPSPTSAPTTASSSSGRPCSAARCRAASSSAAPRWTGLLLPRARDPTPPPLPAPTLATPRAAPDHSGSIPESFYTNGGLKLRVVWTISSLIAAATRHYLLREIVKEHPTLEQVALTDANGQGTLSMGRDQLREFRDKPLAAAAAAAANRTQVPACNMKLRYAPLLELSDGTRIHGATLVVIKPVGDSPGGGRKELDEFVAGAFDGPFREAVAALSKRRTYLLEMNGF